MISGTICIYVIRCILEFMYFRAVDGLIQFFAGLVVCLNLIVHLA